MQPKITRRKVIIHHNWGVSDTCRRKLSLFRHKLDKSHFAIPHLRLLHRYCMFLCLSCKTVSSWVFHSCCCKVQQWGFACLEWADIFSCNNLHSGTGWSAQPSRDAGVPVPAAYESHEVADTSFEHIKSPKGIKSVVARGVSVCTCKHENWKGFFPA